MENFMQTIEEVVNSMTSEQYCRMIDIVASLSEAEKAEFGDGGGFDEAKLEAVIDKYYQENF
jgi:hypothetical protein